MERKRGAERIQPLPPLAGTNSRDTYKYSTVLFMFHENRRNSSVRSAPCRSDLESESSGQPYRPCLGNREIRSVKIDVNLRLKMLFALERAGSLLPDQLKTKTCLSAVDLIAGLQINSVGISAGHFDNRSAAKDSGSVAARLIQNTKFAILIVEPDSGVAAAH